MSGPDTSRRDFLTGKVVLDAAQRAATREIEESEPVAPSRGPTLMLRSTAMACDFDVILDPVDRPLLQAASHALDLVHEIEDQLSVYRPDTEVSRLNRELSDFAQVVDRRLFELLRRARQISEVTGGAFDPATGALIALWRRCRQESRIPTQVEVQQALEQSGIRHIEFDDVQQSIRSQRPGVEFNLGAIGKGYAVDRAGDVLLHQGLENWLVHGGRSSILAHGRNVSSPTVCDGWPIGLQNPLLPDRPFATIVLKDAALATSGTAVQWFRHEGKRYGHILDPRSGWPVETLLSVSVIAPDSALADALSTAFFVLGVEKSLACCDNLPQSVGVIFFPLPEQGQRLQPVLHNVPTENWFPT